MKQGKPPAPAMARDRWQQRSRAFAVRAALAEQELARLRKRVALVERFVRHDVRTPLTVILGHAQMLAEGWIPAARAAQSYSVMVRQSERLNSVLDGLAAPADPPPPGRVAWVTCAPGREQEVAQALVGLLVIVGDPEVCALRDEGELHIDLTDAAMSASELRSVVEAALSEE